MADDTAKQSGRGNHSLDNSRPKKSSAEDSACDDDLSKDSSNRLVLGSSRSAFSVYKGNCGKCSMSRPVNYGSFNSEQKLDGELETDLRSDEESFSDSQGDGMLDGDSDQDLIHNEGEDNSSAPFEAAGKSADNFWSCYHCNTNNDDCLDLCSECTRSKRRPKNLDDEVHISELLNMQGQYSTKNKINVNRLGEEYGKFQGILGDGNCFFRALFVSCMSNILMKWPHNQHYLGRIREMLRISSIKKEFEKDKEATLEFLNDLQRRAEQPEAKAPQKALLELKNRVRNDHTLDESIIQTLRAVTASYVRRHAKDLNAGAAGMTLEEYIPMMTHLSDGQTLEEFCCREIERMEIEAQDIIPKVTVEALGISLRVEIFTGGSQDFFAEDTDIEESLGTVLLRPGHYDVLYRWEYCFWKCETCGTDDNPTCRRPDNTAVCHHCGAKHPSASKYKIGQPVEVKSVSEKWLPGTVVSDNPKGLQGDAAYPNIYDEYSVRLSEKKAGFIEKCLPRLIHCLHHFLARIRSIFCCCYYFSPNGMAHGHSYYISENESSVDHSIVEVKSKDMKPSEQETKKKLKHRYLRYCLPICYSLFVIFIIAVLVR